MKPLYLLVLVLLGLSNCLSAQKLPPSIEWQKCFGGTGDDRGLSIKKAIDGGFIVVGSTKSNNGDLTAHHGSNTTTDAWVMKISATGEKEWQRNYGGTGDDVFSTIIATTDGNYICFGSTTSNNNGDVTGYRGGSDWWVVKIDRQGNILWQKALGSISGYETPGNVRQFSDGSLHFIGTAKGYDGDVTGNAANGNWGDVWIVKMDLDGNIITQKAYGGTAEDEGYDIAEEPDGTYILAINGVSNDGDFAANSGNPPRGRVLKFNPATGVVVWNVLYSRATPLSITPDANGRYTATYNVDYCYPSNVSYALGIQSITGPYPSPGPPGIYSTLGYCVSISLGQGYGYHAEGPNSHAKWNAVDYINVGTYDTLSDISTRQYDGFIAGFYNAISDSTKTAWRLFLGGSQLDHFASVEVISETEFIVIGYTKSNDGEVSGNHGDYDMWVVKLGKTNLIKGSVFIDRNSNGTKESDEPAVSHMLVESKKTGSTFASNVSGGIFVNSVDTGIYVTKPIVTSPYYTAVPASHNSSFTTYNNSDSVGFAIQPIPNKRDYRLTMYTQDFARPGFDMRYVITYENIGTDTIVNKTVTFVKDSRQTLTFTSIPETSISGDTIRWTLNNVLPGQGSWFGFTLTNAPPPDFEIGDTLVVSALLDSTGDLNTTNNYASLQNVFTGSYDPNDKMEAHAGAIPKDELDKGKPFVYTIRFQNTGTDTAFNIVIRDTLDARLDWNSFEMVNASHPYTLTVKDGNQLTWKFANILLVDSNRNEPASHGYVTYRIKAKPGYSINDTIRNTASIYFDFNLPVVTNTTETVIKPDAPPSPVITGLLTSYCGLVGVQTAKITNLPAGGSGITVSVKIDGVAVPIGADSTFSFKVDTMAAGSHTVSVQYTNSSANRISSSGFTVTEPAVPDVRVTSSTTTVSNLATPVVISAFNDVGGGTAPMYTFARERNFANPTQVESVNSTWSFDPSILAIGDNKIYVRMKSNATCIVSNTAVDSVTVVRTTATGITDPDMPGQVINIYPNPFKDVITINGLSSSKKYTISLFNLEGKQLVSKRVSGRSSIAITRQHQATGIYWLSIYDENRKQLLGTVKMLKQ